jgi:hypothetical protein
MIVYGSRSKELAKDILTDLCPNCGKQNSIDMHVFQKYAHVFWIPIFPMGKTGVCQCDHCKQVLSLKEMPASLVISYNNLKEKAKTPIWMFSGLALLAILITIGIISGKKNDEKNAKLILSPKAGDIFEIKVNNSQYTLYKVNEVLGDSVFVQINDYETNKVTGLNDLKKEAYSEEVMGFSKAELKQMLEKGEIIDIERN